MSSLMYKSTIDGTPSQPNRRAPAPAFTPHFRRSLQRHPVLAGVVMAVVTLAILAYAMQMKPVYSAESLVYIEPLSNKVLADASGSSYDPTRYESLLAQEMQTAQRMDIMQAAVAALPPATWSDYGPNAAVAAQNLQGQIKVARVATSYQVSISLKGSDPVKAAAIVNAVTTAFLQAGRKDQLTDADQRSQLLAEERQRIEQELANARAEQTQLSQQLGVANPTGEGANPFDTQLDNMRSQLTSARATHEMAAAQLGALSGSAANHASGLTAAANEAIASDPGLSSMRATINQRRATLSSQMAGLTPGNPVYKQDQDELADLDKTLETMTQQMRDKAARTLQDKLRSELERTGDVAGRLNAEVARQTAHATSAAPRLQRASDLTAEVLRLQTRYASVDNALHSLQLETTGPGMVHLSLAATVPSGPEPSRKRLLELAALPLGFLCGLTAAVFARKRDPRIYTAGDVDEVLGFAPIALLPAHDEVSDAVLQEYYLRLAAGLEGAYRSGGARTFLVTAVSASTEIATLVEAVDRKLGQLGLGAVVVDAGVMLASNNDDAAAQHADGYDRRFEGLAPTILERMKEDHDLVLLESPALLFSAQTEYVARCADVTVLVAESGVTTRQELVRSGALLQRLNVTGVGAVLQSLHLRYADDGFRGAVAELDSRVSYAKPMRREAQAPVAEVHAFVPPVEVVEEPIVQEGAAVVAPVVAEHVVTEPVVEMHAEPEILSVAAPVEAVASVEENAPEPRPIVDVAPPLAIPSFRSNPETPYAEAPTMHKSWLQKLFGRGTEETYSILPDDVEDAEEDRKEDFFAPAPAQTHGMGLVTPVVSQEEPMDLPVREPELVQSVAADNLIQWHNSVPAAPVVAAVTEMPAPRPYVAPVVPVEIFEAPAPAAVVEPIIAAAPERSIPARPLSFAELSQMREPGAVQAKPEEVPAPQPVVEAVAPVLVPEIVEEPVQPVAVDPEPVAVVEPEPEPEPVMEAVAELAPVAQAPVPEPVPALEEWTPAPLNRWDPIPPLRADEAWRSRQFKAAAARTDEPVWAQEDPMHIPPSDRWGAPQDGYPSDEAGETPEIVLTRRWGLLSRFQQGEQFPADNGEQREETPAYRSGDRRG